MDRELEQEEREREERARSALKVADLYPTPSAAEYNRKPTAVERNRRELVELIPYLSPADLCGVYVLASCLASAAMRAAWALEDAEQEHAERTACA